MKTTHMHTLFFSTLTLTMILSGCMPDSFTKWEKEKVKAAQTTTTTTTTSPSNSAPPDLTSLNVFQLRNITEKSTTYHLHKYGQANTSTACEISTSDITDGNTLLTDGANDILCWLEAEETQLYFSGADFQVNAPPGYCEYIQVEPYYFWNAPPINTRRTETYIICDDAANPTCVAAGGASSGSPNLTCAGDYTSIGGPNCDEGRVILNSTSIVGATATVTSTTNACGGKRTNCYAGPGVDFSVSTTGFPRAVDYLAYLGQSINYSVTAPGPDGKGYYGNHYIANFTAAFADSTIDSYTYDYTTIGSATGLERFSNTNEVDNTDPEQEEKAVDPLKRADIGTRMYRVQPFYEFSCLNYAHEVKARIRVQIREWNQNFQMPVANYDEVNRAAPARLLKHSANITDFESSGVGYWNDISSWDIPIAYGPVASYVLVPSATPPAITDPVLPTDGFSFPYLGF